MTQVSFTRLIPAFIYAVRHAVLMVCSVFRTPSLKDLILAVRARDGDTALPSRTKAGAAAYVALTILVY